jgi:preprotein translocase subunit YajC
MLFNTFVANLILLAEDIPQPPRDQGFTQTLIMAGIALLFFYFILWRPEKKRKQEAEEKRNSLKKGDKVTAMGIIGTVYKVQDQTVILRMVDGSKVEFLKGAITDVVPGTVEDVKKVEREEKEE